MLIRRYSGSFVNNEWGTVCDDGWGTTDAQVVCRLLYNLTSGAFYYRNSHFRGGSGPIWLSEVKCNGSETHLVNCSSIELELGVHRCIGNTEDAGVRCAYPVRSSNISQYIIFLKAIQKWNCIFL